MARTPKSNGQQYGSDSWGRPAHTADIDAYRQGACRPMVVRAHPARGPTWHVRQEDEEMLVETNCIPGLNAPGPVQMALLKTRWRNPRLHLWQIMRC